MCLFVARNKLRFMNIREENTRKTLNISKCLLKHISAKSVHVNEKYNFNEGNGKPC